MARMVIAEDQQAIVTQHAMTFAEGGLQLLGELVDVSVGVGLLGGFGHRRFCRGMLGRHSSVRNVIAGRPALL